jgi:hypothetical protein
MGFVRFVRVQWDRVAGGACVIAGVVALVVGWAQVSSAVYPAAQFPYLISCGVGGLFLLGVGATLWLSADLRDEWRHLDSLEERVAARLEARLREEAGQPAAAADTVDGPRPVPVRNCS